MAWLKKKTAEFCHDQWVDWSNVVPEHRWNPAKRSFHLVSCAGAIHYKPKTEREVIEFRDKYINRFEAIRREPAEEHARLFHELYTEIRGLKRTSYNANLRTRLQGKAWSLRNLF
jgi:hypothetical protein